MTDMGIKKANAMKIGEYQELDEALYIWFGQQREKEMPVTWPILTEKAKLLFPQLYPDLEKAFTAITGFLWHFCKKCDMKE